MRQNAGSSPEVFVPVASCPERTPPWRQVRLYLVLVALVSLGTGVSVGRWANAEPVQATLPPPDLWTPWCGVPASTRPASSADASEIWYIYVTGAVVHPRVITVTAGSLVTDALAAAGGPAPEADLDAINLAAPLQNYQHIRVPFRPLTPTPEPTAAINPEPDATPATLININTAEAATLETLPKIGPSMAQRIVAYRQEHGPFQTIADIQQVPGIGPSIFAAIEPYITVGP